MYARRSRGGRIQHRGNPCVGEVGVRIDQRRARASVGIFGGDQDRGRTGRLQRPPIAPIREKTQRTGLRIRQCRDARDAQIRIAAQHEPEAYGQLTQTVSIGLHVRTRTALGALGRYFFGAAAGSAAGFVFSIATKSPVMSSCPLA